MDLGALGHNLQLAGERSGGCRVMAVVKSDAYGHGLATVGDYLADRVDYLAVGRVDEGCRLRARLATPIVVLQGCQDRSELQACREHRLQPVLHSVAQLEAFNDAQVECWLKFDTGMHRLGMPLESLAVLLKKTGRLRVQGLLTHLACADEPGHPLNRLQLAGFRQLSAQAAGRGCLASAANSAALLALPDFHGDCIRPGLMLYGVSPFSHATPELRPVMRLCAPVVALAEVSAGGRVGYGADWTAQGARRVATVAIGYADGYPRELSDEAHVLVRGRPCPLAGRVSMELLAADVSALPEVAVGDEVVLWGDAGLRVEQVATWAGTIPYTLLTQVSSRVERRALA